MEGGQSLNQESFKGAVKTAEKVLEKAERAAVAAREETCGPGICASYPTDAADCVVRPGLREVQSY
ncbi:hypothetical protein [Actinacidiphila glaucinigra]|uniref:hypothetical protein n=1 Tax=Actinacidiphila glaucinigra TaxID=235986 RepID=UPI0035DE2120